MVSLENEEFFPYPSYSLTYEFHVDRWNHLLNRPRKLILLDSSQLVAILHSWNPFLRKLKREIDQFVRGNPTFYRLSSRSAKDLGVDGLISNNAQDLLTSLGQSERIKEDINLHLQKDQEEKLYLVLDKVVNFAEEIRCFVSKGRIIAASTYLSSSVRVEEIPFEKYSSIPEVQRILEVYLEYPSLYCIDLGRIEEEWQVIEINPVNEYTDCLAIKLSDLQCLVNAGK